MIETIDPFRPFIFKTKFDFSKLEITDRIEESIFHYADSELGLSNFQTTILTAHSHTYIAVQPYIDFINDTIAEIWKVSDLADLQRFITSSHLNRYTQGYALREHAHPGVDYVITGYIKKPVNSGDIEVRNPLEYQWHTLPINGHPDESWRPISAEENDVLIFPGWLYHRTQPSQCDLPRVALSMMIRTRLAQGIE